jgi:hypothetical protein
MRERLLCIYDSYIVKGWVKRSFVVEHEDEEKINSALVAFYIPFA